MDKKIKENLILSYQTDGGFCVHDVNMLEKVYNSLGLDPKTSLDRRIYELEALTHFFQSKVISLFKLLNIKKRRLCVKSR